MLVDTVLAAMADPFRIGLLIALFVTMLRTRAATGTVIPLLAGAVFVAAIIPTVMRPPAPGTYLTVVIAGFLANLVILAAIWAIWTLIARARG